MPEFEVTVIARKITDVSLRVQVQAKNKKDARAKVNLMLVQEDRRVADDMFHPVDKPMLTSVEVEDIRCLDQGGV